MAEDSPRTLGLIALPLGASLLVTGGVVAVLCRVPGRPVLSWQQLLLVALVYVAVAFCAHAFSVWAVCRLLRGYIAIPVWRVICESWVAAGWLPSLALLGREGSVLLCGVVPLIAGCAILFLSRWRTETEGPLDIPPEGRTGALLFEAREPIPLWRPLLPAVLMAIAFETGVGSLAADRLWVAGCCFAVCSCFLMWNLRGKAISGQQQEKSSPSFGTVVWSSALAFLFTTVALLPFIESGKVAGEFEGLLNLRRPVQTVNAAARKESQFAGNSYSGIVLLLPEKPHARVVPRAPAVAHGTRVAMIPAKPLVIVFDGAYWFYKNPDQRPKPDAKVQHGDPLKTRIRSADWQPLLMAAHQSLGTPIQVSCCSMFRIDLVNADDRPGALAIEVQLSDSRAKGSTALSLGGMVLHSSDAARVFLNRPPVEETLNFRLSSIPQGRQFDEITVFIKPARERSLAGVRVAIKDFVLVP